MSTRATYSFEQKFSKKGIVVYVHSDNYPEGASVYFWRMYKHLHCKGGLGECFVKGNPMSAEFTSSHDAHGDTEYRYYLDKHGFLEAQKMDPITETYVQTFFSGHYSEFINHYHQCLTEAEDGFERLYLLSDSVKAVSHSRCLTLRELKQKLMDVYTSALEGSGVHKAELPIWEAEYQRLKLLNKSS